MDKRRARLRRLTPELHRRHEAEADRLVQPLVAEASDVMQALGLKGIANDWLDRMAWKRTAASLLYGDLLCGGSRRRIVEIGGGLSGLTLRLAAQHDYTLIERSTHDAADAYLGIERHVGRQFVTVSDWADIEPMNAEIVIAADLFPNVDQRLYEFIDRYLPSSTEMRLTLTFYEDTIFDVVRESSGEHLTIKPWGLREMDAFVEWLQERHEITIPPSDLADVTYENHQSVLFGNRRNVLLMWIERAVD